MQIDTNRTLCVEHGDVVTDRDKTRKETVSVTGSCSSSSNAKGSLLLVTLHFLRPGPASGVVPAPAASPVAGPGARLAPARPPAPAAAAAPSPSAGSGPRPGPASAAAPAPRAAPAAAPAALLLDPQPLSVQLEVVLVVERVLEASAVGELDDAVAGAGDVHVRVGDVSRGAEEVLQVLLRKREDVKLWSKMILSFYTCQEVLLDRFSTMIL